MSMHCLHLDHVSVEFPIYHGGRRSLKKRLFALSTRGNIARDAFDQISVSALDDVTLDIADGDRIGLIGANGAGKTTLLKVMAGIYHPTGGRVHAAGRTSALLDPMLGFNPEATGRENIFLRGMYMDIHPREMRKRVHEIIAFAAIGPYIDMPVRTYSAGMTIRLGFAISTCIPPEILLMDEWLSVGDAEFLRRAQKRTEEFIGGSNILVFASHSLPLLRRWCTRGILLQKGRVVATGDIKDVIALYAGNRRSAGNGAAGHHATGELADSGSQGDRVPRVASSSMR
jgi:ABC-2 type transport system ATP-binding protein/lipopolysaccharide transport system ATP-binding protein